MARHSPVFGSQRDASAVCLLARRLTRSYTCEALSYRPLLSVCLAVLILCGFVCTEQHRLLTEVVYVF